MLSQKEDKEMTMCCLYYLKSHIVWYHATIHSDISLHLFIVSFYICDQNPTQGPTKYTKNISI